VVRDEASGATAEVALDAKPHKSGAVWHALLAGLPPNGVLYAYK